MKDISENYQKPIIGSIEAQDGKMQASPGGGRGVSQTISYFDTSPKSIAAIKRFGHGHPRQTGRTSDCIYQPVSVQKYPKK